MQPPKQDFKQTLGGVDPDEKLLAVIRRHPFGIIRLYAIVVFGLAAAAVIVMYVLPNAFPREDYSNLYSVIALAAVLVVAIMALILAVATVIYTKSNLVITDKTITQTLQLSLFNKKISQLAVSSVEDVTANTNGVFPTLLGYGRLLIETAGEQENFYFDYCPHADHYAKLVLETRQQFMGSREFEMRETAHATQVQNQNYQQQQAAYQQMPAGYPTQQSAQAVPADPMQPPAAPPVNPLPPGGPPTQPPSNY